MVPLFDVGELLHYSLRDYHCIVLFNGTIVSSRRLFFWPVNLSCALGCTRGHILQVNQFPRLQEQPCSNQLHSLDHDLGL